MAHPQGARGMQNAASNALQLAATRYTAGTAPFSGGGVASGAQAEVVDLTGSFPKEAAKQQPAKRRRPASGEHPFQALDDSEARALPCPHICTALHLTSSAMGSDTRGGGLNTRSWACGPHAATQRADGHNT